MKSNLFLAAFFTCSAFLITSGFSQESSTAPYHFRMLAWGGQISGLYFSQEQPPGPDPANPDQPLADPAYKEVLLQIPLVCRSDFIPYDKQKPLFFVQHVAKLYKVVATLDLSTSPNLPLLLITRHVDGTYKVTVSSDDQASFPAGAFRFTNTTSTPVVGVIGTSQFKLQPGENTVIKPTPDSNGQLMMKLYANSKQPFVSTRWGVNEGDRTMIFVVDAPMYASRYDILLLKDSALAAIDPNPTPSPR